MGLHTWFYSGKESHKKQLDCEFHDVFRASSWEDTEGLELKSLEETLNFINNPDNGCILYDKTTEDLEKFWSKYPKGIIEFG